MEWTDKSQRANSSGDGSGEGDMGTNVVWMMPQLWQPKDSHSSNSDKAHRTHLSDGELMETDTETWRNCVESGHVYSCTLRKPEQFKKMGCEDN